jgi:hypothetical protein
MDYIHHEGKLRVVTKATRKEFEEAKSTGSIPVAWDFNFATPVLDERGKMPNFVIHGRTMVHQAFGVACALPSRNVEIVRLAHARLKAVCDAIAVEGELA